MSDGVKGTVVDGVTGEVVDQDFIAYAYTREGRKEVGKEYPNPVPVAAPIGFVPSKPIHEQIRDMVVRELSARAQAEGFETAEEADDFRVSDDDYDPSSPWEEQFEPEDPWPPRPAVADAEAAVVAARGGGGAEPPGGEPSSAPSAPPPAKP